MSIAPRDEPEASEILALKEESEAREGAAVVQPDGWARPRGYTNGAFASGKIVTVAGQVGWNPETCLFKAGEFVAQVPQALHNLVQILSWGGRAAPRTRSPPPGTGGNPR